MKNTKKIVSFLLSAIMVVTTFLAVGPVFTIEASAADITIGGITQTRVVSNWASVYESYRAKFFNSSEQSWPTDIVIPGLSSSENYIPQGMTYWEAKGWILISAYDAAEEKNTAIFAVDIVSGDLMAVYKIQKKNGDPNKSHGGGIAASEHNFYFADTKDSTAEGASISYWPLAEMDVEPGTEKYITIYDSISCSGELNGANASYCCYDEGVLWVGNFFYGSENWPQYNKPANSAYNSMLLGYKLVGTNSADEWAYLKGAYSKPITLTATSGSDSKNNANFTWTATSKSDVVTVTGSITAPTSYVGEFCPSFASFELTEGNSYILEFTTNTNKGLSDLYIFAPNGKGHTNVKQSSQTTITELADGTYRYRMEFVAGLKPTGADSAWPTTQSTDGSFTGTYTMRFDQDAIQAGEARDFTMSDIRISETPINALKLTTTGGTATNTNAKMTYSITEDTSDGTFDITGTATNTSGAKLELTAKYAKIPLVEGETYTMEFIADNQLTDAYIFAPSGAPATHMRLFAQRGVSIGNGKYKYSTTFTAGRRLDGYSGGDYTWPEIQSIDGSFTGMYTIRFDQDDIQNNETRTFNITDIKLRKTDSTYQDNISITAGKAGSPTYCIGLYSGLDKVQYAMVDKGKIYISRSWDRDGGSTHVRALAIGDMDINVPGTVDMTVNGKSVKGYEVQAGDITEFSGDDMFYMSEALCIIDDYLYMFSEGAAYKYQNGDGGGSCPEPIDVIWKIDQHAIMNSPRSSTEDIEASHYEKVTDLSQLTSGDEYLVVHESLEKDRVTQKNILYLLDSYGGYGENKLPKNDNPTKDNTGDSMGVVGYKITSYTTDGNKLYIDDLDDARKSIRWKVTHNGSGANLRLENMDHYYGQHKYFNFNSRVMAMSTASSSEITGNYLNLLGVPDKAGSFYIYSTLGQVSGKYPYYLWCNDGSNPNPNVNYIEKYTDYYKNHPALSYTPPYDGLDETAGTFHTDALLQDTQYGGNMLGEEIYTYELAEFSFYKRVPDPHAFTGESQVYTDLKAEVQSDGTLNLNLETYATARLHYKTLDAKRPTDYIFVMDKSGSMDDSEGGAYQPRWRMDSDGDWGKGDLNMATVVGRKDGGPFKVDGTKVMGYDYYSNCYYRTSDGIYRLLKGAVKTTKDDWWDGWKRQLYWVYYQDDSGVCYVLNSSGTFDNRGSYDTFKTMVDNEQNYTYNAHSNSQEGRSTATLFSGMYYTYTSSAQVLSQEQNLAIQMTYDIAADAAATGLDHRIAVCRVGYMPGQGDSNTTTAYYKAGNTTPIALTVTSGFSSSQDFSGVFNSISQFGTVRTIIDNLVTGGHSHTDYAMKTMVPKMINSSGYDYSYNGTRTVCVVLFTDGGMCSIEDEMSSADAAGAGLVAGSTIMGAKDIKEAGGHIYTVQVGTEDIGGGWDETLQLRCISSEFVSAKSGSDTGEASPWDVDFYHKVTTSSFNHTTESTAIMEQINKGRKYALAKLDANAVLREQLDQESFSFENVSASDITIGTQKAYYDAIGRLQFEETQPDSTITADTSQANNGLITITGFDYSKNYVSSITADDGTAKKLVITIKNVDFADDVVNMTDINRPIVDVPVSLADPTGIYMSNGEKHRSFPEDRVTIPQYTYVFDYGLGMFDVDINGTLISVDTALRKQSTYSDSKTQGNTSLTFTEDRQDMTYTINKDATDMQRYFVLIQRPNGEYDWFAINIVPATNVYFEQDIFAVSNTAKATWNPVGSTQFTNQSISLWDDVYGYDENYLADNSNYSQGAALKTTVTSSNNRSDTMKTTFNGNGFDLYSVCGPNTGVQIVKFYPTGTTDPMNFKSYVIDTFYNDTNFPGPLYQVPILRHECSYGNYTVEVTSAYLSIAGALQTQSVESAVIDENGTISYTSDFTNDKESAILEQLGFEELIGTDVEFIWHSEDSVLNGGKGAQGVDEGSFTTQAVTSLENYIDGIRVYHPGGDNMDTYYKESEKGATYYNVFDNMKAGVFSGSGISYIYGTAGGQSLNFAEELEKLFEGRPKNEVYLENSGNNSITFTVDNLDENSRVMVSLRAAQGSPKAQVNNNVFVDGSITRMEMYYDITEYLTIADGKATVIIKNAGSGLLAVDNIKVTGAGGISAQSELSDVFEIFSLDVVEVDPRQPSISTSGDIGEIPLPPVPDQPDNNEPDDGNDNILPPSDDDNPEEPAEDGFFAKVESFFVKIFNFFKNIFNKVSTFFKF